MASLAIGSYSLVVHIGMTVNTGCFCFRKHQTRMTLPAVKPLVLARERHRRLVMIERVNRLIKGPAFRTVAKITTKLEIFAMRVICHQP